jgi:hypothetical protein
MNVCKTISYGDGKVVLATSEVELAQKLNKQQKRYNFKVSAKKTKVIAFKGKTPFRSRTVLDYQIL